MVVVDHFYSDGKQINNGQTLETLIYIISALQTCTTLFCRTFPSQSIFFLDLIHLYTTFGLFTIDGMRRKLYTPSSARNNGWMNK